MKLFGHGKKMKKGGKSHGRVVSGETPPLIESKYRNFLEVLHEGIWVIDKDAYTTFVNPRMAEIFGYPVNEMVGKHLFSFMDKKSIATCKRLLGRRQRGIRERHEFEFIRKGGGRIHALLATSPITNDKGNYIGAIASVQDITEQKMADETLRVKDAAIASSINAIAMADIKGNLTYVNPSFLKMWGYGNDKDVLGKPVVKFWETEKCALEVVKALRRRGLWTGELAAKKKDGSTFYVQLLANAVKDEGGKPICTMASFADITERKKAEEVLRESEEKYRFIVDNSKEAVFIISRTGKVLFINNCMLGISGYSENEVVGKSITRFLTGDSVKKALFALTQEFLGRPQPEIIVGVKTKSGGIRYLEVSRGSTPVHEKGKQIGILVSAMDVTERKKAETELKDSEERWTSLTGNTNDIIMMVDNKGVIRYINKTIPPYTQEGTIGKSLYEYTQAEQHDIMRKSLKKVFKRGEPDSYEISSKIPKIGIVWFNTKMVPVKRDGSVDSVIMVSTDITERKKAEEAIRESEERFKMIFEYAPDAYYLNDLRGNFIDGNIAAEKLTGYKRDELVGKSFLKLKLLPADQIPRAAALLVRNAIGHATGPDEFKLLRRDGTEVPVEIRTYPVEIAGKKTVLGIAHDITNRKRLEEESNRRSEDLAKSKEELERKVEEFERLNRLAVGRELKMIELKKRIEELEKDEKQNP